LSCVAKASRPAALRSPRTSAVLRSPKTLTRAACSWMLAMTRLANSSAARPAAPFVRGSLRERAASTNASSSACNGSTAGAFSFSNPNSGCGPASSRRCEEHRAAHNQRNVLVLLEETHLAHAFGGNPAGGDIGYSSSRKFKARMRDVDFVRQDGNPTALTSATCSLTSASKMSRS